MIIWHMHIACWVPKTTNTHSGYVILLSVPQQQWLYERASMLHRSTLFVFQTAMKFHILLHMTNVLLRILT